MKRAVPVCAFLAALLFLGSCSQRGDGPALGSPGDWVPPVYPGAIADIELQGNMTAVAATPEGLDKTAYSCFGFPVHDAVFYAYRADAPVQDILDFYSTQMLERGWREVLLDVRDPTLPQQVWQHGETGLLVAYLMVAPMEDGQSLIYISVAESDSPQKTFSEE